MKLPLVDFVCAFDSIFSLSRSLCSRRIRPTVLPSTSPPRRFGPSEIRAHIRFLADSLLQGARRARPAMTLRRGTWPPNWKAWDSHPAVSGSWFQPVPLEKAVTDGSASSLVLTLNGKEQKLADAKDYILSTWFASPAGKGESKAESDVSAPAVFVGFGVTAPDQKYDDYAGVDVRGQDRRWNSTERRRRFPPPSEPTIPTGIVKAKNAVAHGAVGVVSDDDP